MGKAFDSEITAKQKLQSFFEGTAQAFNDWLSDSDKFTASFITNGVKQAFADWLKDNHTEIMNVIREHIKENME